MREIERTMEGLTPDDLCDLMCGGPEEEPEGTINPREILCEAGYAETLLFDNPDFDTAIIGVTDEGRAVYDFEKMITQLAEDEEITREEAIEVIEHNTIRSLTYVEDGPIIMHSLEDLH